MILDNRRITIKEVADDVGISFGSFKAIFTDILGIKCCMTSRDLDDGQRRSRFAQKCHNW